MSYQDGYSEGVLYATQALQDLIDEWSDGAVGDIDELLEELQKLQSELSGIYNNL